MCRLSSLLTCCDLNHSDRDAMSSSRFNTARWVPSFTCSAAHTPANRSARIHTSTMQCPGAILSLATTASYLEVTRERSKGVDRHQLRRHVPSVVQVQLNPSEPVAEPPSRHRRVDNRQVCTGTEANSNTHRDRQAMSPHPVQCTESGARTRRQTRSAKIPTHPKNIHPHTNNKGARNVPVCDQR